MGDAQRAPLICRWGACGVGGCLAVVNESHSFVRWRCGELLLLLDLYFCYDLLYDAFEFPQEQCVTDIQNHKVMATFHIFHTPHTPFRAHAGIVRWRHHTISCLLGKAGVTRHKKEGDGATPVGIMRGHALFYRSDRIPPPPCPITPRPIRRSMRYCDDPASPLYNRLFFTSSPPSCSHERLWRNDGLYDIILILTHNRHPTVTARGSAIFIHLADNETSHTQGCIACHYDDLCFLLSHVTKRSRFIIHER